MSQPGHRQLEHLPLGRIHQRVLSQFWLGFAGPWDILKQKQAVCLWGRSCEGLGWCHIARLSHRLFPSQRRDQLPVASEQRHLGDTFQGSPGGRSCYGVFWKLAASRLTVLEMAVDDRCCPHSLVNLRSVSVDFIVWSLSIAILFEFGLSLFSCDHTFAHPFNEAVSLRIVFMCSWREGWCPQGADRFYVNLRRYHGLLHLETNGFCRGLGHSSFSIWPREIQISCGWVKFM